MSYSAVHKDPKDRWRTGDRHYCQICNAWMGGDRVSILTHENGKKHKLKLEESLKQKRQDKNREQKDALTLEKQFRAIEKAATQAHWGDLVSGAFAGGTDIDAYLAASDDGVSTTVSSEILVTNQSSSNNMKTGQKKKELDSWHLRKERRENEKQTDETEDLRKSGENEYVLQDIPDDVGHYNVDDSIYLEGLIFGTILKEGMTAEIWIGSSGSDELKKRKDSNALWREGIVTKVNTAKSNNTPTRCDFAYLRSPTDTEETLEMNLCCSRIRIKLGSSEGVPKTLEEARIARLGGERVQQFEASTEVDENTGFTSWSTVEVRKATVDHEVTKERSRIRAKEREEAQKLEDMKKEVDIKKMEEARYANADDSALGAYDVWSTTKGGYKGVDISKELKLDVNDTAKSLSNGASVSFKKREAPSRAGSMFMKGNKKKNFRRKSVDDE